MLKRLTEVEPTLGSMVIS
jgi:hypothetical protein